MMNCCLLDMRCAYDLTVILIQHSTISIFKQEAGGELLYSERKQDTEYGHIAHYVAVH
jgi:hypothetical protein